MMPPLEQTSPEIVLRAVAIGHKQRIQRARTTTALRAAMDRAKGDSRLSLERRQALIDYGISRLPSMPY